MLSPEFTRWIKIQNFDLSLFNKKKARQQTRLILPERNGVFPDVGRGERVEHDAVARVHVALGGGDERVVHQLLCKLLEQTKKNVKQFFFLFRGRDTHTYISV